MTRTWLPPVSTCFVIEIVESRDSSNGHGYLVALRRHFALSAHAPYCKLTGESIVLILSLLEKCLERWFQSEYAVSCGKGEPHPSAQLGRWATRAVAAGTESLECGDRNRKAEPCTLAPIFAVVRNH